MTSGAAAFSVVGRVLVAEAQGQNVAAFGAVDCFRPFCYRCFVKIQLLQVFAVICRGLAAEIAQGVGENWSLKNSQQQLRFWAD